MDVIDILFVFVCLLTTLGVVTCSALIVVNWRYRHNRLVKMSSPTINIIMLMGAILLYSTNVVYGLTSLAPTFLCRLWAWLLPVSFSLLFGCLFGKSWRVNRIFTRPHETKTVIRDGRLGGVVCGLVGVDIIIMTVWEIVNGQTENAGKATGNEVTMTSHCAMINYAQIFVTILLVYKGLCLIYGAYLAWAIRHVTIPPMDDSSCILIAGHVTVILTCLGISGAVMMSEFEAARYGCIAGSVWLATTVTVGLEFAPKVHYWMKHQNDELLKVTLSPYGHQSPHPDQPCTPPTAGTSSNSSQSSFDENKNHTDGTLKEVVPTTPISETALPFPPLEDTPTRPLSSRKQDSPDSGHDSPRDQTQGQGQFIMYQIENDLVAVEVPELPVPKLQKSMSVVSATSDYDVTMEHHVMRRQLYYEYLRRNRRLASTITKTYDLDSDSDTMTYISHCLSPSPSMNQVGRELWTIGNDGLYPKAEQPQQQRHYKRHPKRKTRSQRHKMSSQLAPDFRRQSSASVV